MSIDEDHSWNLRRQRGSYLPESNQAFERKLDEWQARDWQDWLSRHLSFPFNVARKEDEDDAYFVRGAARAPFRLGHTMSVFALAGQDVDQGVMVKVKESGSTAKVPLCDVEVTPNTDPNFWPVREYVVWFANRHL